MGYYPHARVGEHSKRQGLFVIVIALVPVDYDYDYD